MEPLEQLKKIFINPPSEFSPIPFWFWNDELSKEEIIKQIHAFHAKEVDGFVIHPRMGLPRSMPYLSDAYMNLVEVAVAEAEQLGMKVILYDEGMYPSGSACGMVVKHNPEYASRGLQLREHSCGEVEAGAATEVEKVIKVSFALSPGEKLVSVQAVCKLSASEIVPEHTLVLNWDQKSDSIEFCPPHSGNWSVLFFIDTYSKGTIRGVHAGQDDGEPDVPLAADLLNLDATNTFIALTHERYYEKLSRYFGATIFAMFTDEPDLLGRGHKRGLQPWTTGFMEEYLAGGGREQELPALWFGAGEETEQIRHLYKELVRNRLVRTYYKPLADWCEAHGIGLTGHPAESDDIGLLEYFHIPGQDLVWRSVAPEDGKSLTGVGSTIGKCSSDAARHRGRRRNLNECFGVCGSEGGWTLTADNMKWYLDWLFVRGVNLISPHAFYYSIRDERRDERPPDVGPNNIWWSEYAQFARYMKRMSWMMTDSKNGAEVAILTGKADMPWKIAKPLYEQQIEFNYLEEDLLQTIAECKEGMIQIAGYSYNVILIEDGRKVASESWKVLEKFITQGGVVIELSNTAVKSRNIRQILAGHEQEMLQLLIAKTGQIAKLKPASEHIRISHVTKDGAQFYVVVNEGEVDYNGALRIRTTGRTELWRPWEGSCEPAVVQATESDQQVVACNVQRRECLIVAVEPGATGAGSQGSDVISILDSGHSPLTKITDLSTEWEVVSGPWSGQLSQLASWTEWSDMAYFSGTVVYEKQFELDNPSQWSSIQLDLGMAHELAQVWINDQYIDVRMWKPYTFEIGSKLRQGNNTLRVSVTNSLANEYDGKSLDSGLIGPVTFLGQRN